MKSRLPILAAATLAMSTIFVANAQAEGGTAPNTPNDAGVSTPRSSDSMSNDAAAPANDSAAPAEESSGGVGQTISDAAITTSVKSKLIANSNTSGRNIKVTTENGVVMLSGHVKSEAEKTLALQIASDTKGVKGVHNALKVAGSS